MNRFTADYSSSPANTPPRRRDLSNESRIASTTPLVPPPSTVFGSSRLGPGKSLFSNQTPSTASKSYRQTPPSQRARGSGPGRHAYDPAFTTSTVDEDDDEENDFEDDQPPPVKSLMQFSTNSPRRSTRAVYRKSTHSHSILPSKGNSDIVGNLARKYGSQAEGAPLEQDDGLILDTELFIQQLNSDREQAIDDESLRSLLDAQVQDLSNLWRAHTSQDSDPTLEIGPSSKSSAFDQAYYLSSMILTLHHPGQSSIPGALLAWLNKHHVTVDGLSQTVANTSPNATAHTAFWEVVLSLTLRGRLQAVMRLLQDADFQYAQSALDDGEQEPGFHGAQLQTIQSIIFRVRQVINSCPAIKGNWETTSEEWAAYRSNVESELDNLGQLASGEQGDEDDFEASNFGIRKPQRDLLRKSQRSRNLPWSIYTGIRVLYGILIGSSAEIIAQSQDWLEASCALTIWWDGASDAKITNWSREVGRATNSATGNASTDPYLNRLRDSFLCVTDPSGKETFPINSVSPVEIALGCALQGSISPFLGVTRTLSQCIATAIAEVAASAGWMSNGSHAGLDLNDLLVLNSGATSGTLTKDDILMSYASALFDRGEMSMPDGSIIDGWEVAMSVISRLDDDVAMNNAVNDLLEQLDVRDEERMQRVINLCTDLRFTSQSRSMSDKLGDHLAQNTSNYGEALLCYAKSHNRERIQQLIEMLISYCLVQSRAWPATSEIDTALLSLVETPKLAFANVIETDPEAASMLQFHIVGYACVRKIFTNRDSSITPTSRSTHSSIARMGGAATRKRIAAKALVAAINSAADAIYGGLYDPQRRTAVQVDALLPLLGEATAFLAPNYDTARAFTNDQIYSLLAAIEDLETVTSRVREASEACVRASLEEFHGARPMSPGRVLGRDMSSGTNSNFSFSFMGSAMLDGSGVSATTGGGRSEGSAVLVPSAAAGGKNGEEVRRAWDWREAFKGVPEEDLVKVLLRRLRVGLARELSLGELDG